MAHFLALEWDSHEARVAVARSRGTGVTIEHAFTVDLSPRETDETSEEPKVGERIAAALAARRIGRCDTLVAVGRSEIELRLLSLPPAPDDELPELVRFQAVRQFSALGDDWSLDFFPVDQHQQREDMPRSVLAAAMSPELVKQIERNCEAAQLRVQRMVLRPCAAASLVLRKQTDEQAKSARLLVDVLGDEADLTVTVDRTVVFMRTIRLPGKLNSPQQALTLLGEIRRTRAAAQTQLGGQAVEQVVLFGTDDDHATLRPQIEEKLELPTVAFDPFMGLSVSGEVKSHPPEHPGRFAPLLGILVDECRGAQHAIDFLHPRKKPEPPSQSRRYALIGAAASVVILSIVGYLWMGLRNLDHKTQLRKDELAELEQGMDRAEKLESEATEIDLWASGDVTWLDELTRLATQIPNADDLMLTKLETVPDDRNRARNGGGDRRRRGKIRMEGVARDDGVVDDLVTSLRDESHHTSSDGLRQDSRDQDYPWRFTAEVIVDLPESEPATKAATDDAADQNEEPVESDESGEQPAEEAVAPEKPSIAIEESADSEENRDDRSDELDRHTEETAGPTENTSDLDEEPAGQIDNPDEETSTQTHRERP